MKNISLIMFFLFASSIAVASEKMTGKTKAWLTSQPGVSAIGCDSFEDQSYSISKREGFYIKESSFKNPKLFSDSKLTCDLWSDIADSEKLTLYIIEESKVDGVRVSLFQSDGSGSVGKDYNDKSAWQFGCKTDAMTDEYNCHISHKHFYVVKDGAGYHVIVGSEHFPKTRSLIRIDDEKPIESGEDGIFSPEQSEKIVEALSSGKKLRIRYTKWPRETPVDEVIDMKYFDTSKKVLNTIFDNHK